MTVPTSLTRRDLARAAAATGLAGAAPALVATPAAGATVPRLSAEDRLDIIELMARYAWAYDCLDAAALAATFTPDGILAVSGKVMAQGQAGFASFIATAAAMRQANGWQHLTDHHVFTAHDATHCTVHSYYLMPESDAAGGNVHLRAMGYYESLCQRTRQGWRFARREAIRWNGRQPF
jgi:ketosteroid isomerase-like protein